CVFLFFFNEAAPTEISPLSLHAALPICDLRAQLAPCHIAERQFFDLVARYRSEEHTSELQSHSDLVCRLLLEKSCTPAASARFTQLSTPLSATHSRPPLGYDRNAASVYILIDVSVQDKDHSDFFFFQG